MEVLVALKLWVCSWKYKTLDALYTFSTFLIIWNIVFLTTFTAVNMIISDGLHTLSFYSRHISYVRLMSENTLCYDCRSRIIVFRHQSYTESWCGGQIQSLSFLDILQYEKHFLHDKNRFHVFCGNVAGSGFCSISISVVFSQAFVIWPDFDLRDCIPSFKFTCCQALCWEGFLIPRVLFHYDWQESIIFVSLHLIIGALVDYVWPWPFIWSKRNKSKKLEKHTSQWKRPAFTRFY